MEQLSPQQQREALLVALYDHAGGSVSSPFETKEAAKVIGLDTDRAGDHVVTLKQSRHVDHLTAGGTGFLTARGIAEAERLKQRQQQAPTPAAVFLSAIERADLEAFVGALDRSDIEEQLDGDDLLEYQSELDTARAQAKSPRPKRQIVRVVVGKLIEFAVQTGANVAANVVSKVAGF